MSNLINHIPTEIGGVSIQDLTQAGIIPAGTPPAQIVIFAQVCAETKLSPLKKEIYLMKGSSNGSPVWYNIVSIGGLRKYAEATGTYLGKSQVMYDLKSDGSYRTLAEYGDGQMPKTVSIVVYKLVGGARAEFPATIAVKEYLKAKALWASLPITMLSKTVEAHALRAAFSGLSGLYEESELGAIRGETTQAIAASNKVEIDIDELKSRIMSASTRDEVTALYKSTPTEWRGEIVGTCTERVTALCILEIESVDSAERLAEVCGAIPQNIRQRDEIAEAIANAENRISK